jgi:hypothetical protein
MTTRAGKAEYDRERRVQSLRFAFCTCFFAEILPIKTARFSKFIDSIFLAHRRVHFLAMESLGRDRARAVNDS